MFSLIAIAAALAACCNFVFLTDMSRFWKGVAVLITGAAVFAQFHPDLSREVHFLVPLLAEVFVGLWGAFYMKMQLA